VGRGTSDGGTGIRKRGHAEKQQMWGLAGVEGGRKYSGNLPAPDKKGTQRAKVGTGCRTPPCRRIAEPLCYQVDRGGWIHNGRIGGAKKKATYSCPPRSKSGETRPVFVEIVVDKWTCTQGS